MPIERDLGHFKSRHSENSIRQQFQLWINDVDDALRVPRSSVMNKLAKLIDSISFTISSSIDSRKFFFFLSKLRLNSRKMVEEAVYTPVLSRPNYVSFHPRLLLFIRIRRGIPLFKRGVSAKSRKRLHLPGTL